MSIRLPPKGDPFWEECHKSYNASLRARGLSHLIREGPEKLVARYKIQTSQGEKFDLYRFNLDYGVDVEEKITTARKHEVQIARKYSVPIEAVSLNTLTDERSLRNSCLSRLGVPVPVEPAEAGPTCHFYFCDPAEEMPRVGMA